MLLFILVGHSKVIVLAGPYMGDFEQEVVTFRPYVRWLYDVAEFQKMYISTHANRTFMYQDLISEDSIIPVSEDLSRDELGQEGYVHNLVTTKDYQIHLKLVKDEILDREKCTRKDIVVYGLNYIKSMPPFSIYNKKFAPIFGYDDVSIDPSKVVFIPDISESKDRLKQIRQYLIDNKIDYVTAGDMNTWFSKDNAVTNRIDYYENGWKYNLNLISNASAVICPLGSWTTICNIQSVPVFSWGQNTGQHREGGIYNFGNGEKCFVFPADANTKQKVFENMLNLFFQTINRKVYYEHVR